MRDGSLGGASERAIAESEFRHAVETIFADRCKAAWLSGSFLYKGAKPGRSDIDVVVVLDERTALPADHDTIRRIRAFVDVYLDLHARLGLDPDLDFPAEYVVPQAIEEAISWRGLSLQGSVADAFPAVENSDYWLGRPDRWFNAWLSETAFSHFLTGDAVFHSAAKLTAWKTILRFLLLRGDGQPMGLENFWTGLAQFGVKESYLPFWPQEESWVQRAIDDLVVEGSAVRVADRVAPSPFWLAQWEKQIQAAIDAHDESGPLLLPPGPHDEIAAFAERRWSERAASGEERLTSNAEA